MEDEYEELGEDFPYIVNINIYKQVFLFQLRDEERFMYCEKGLTRKEIMESRN